MALQRKHILLEPEQQKQLTEIAQREGRSVSDVARQFIQEGIRRRHTEYQSQQQNRMAALERIRRVREAIQTEWGDRTMEIAPAALIGDMREERDGELLGVILGSLDRDRLE